MGPSGAGRYKGDYMSEPVGLDYANGVVHNHYGQELAKDVVDYLRKNSHNTPSH